MKRKKAKEILAESFREIADVKAIDKITIQEIVDNCSYSPATFYRHFRDKYDLIAWDYAQGIEHILDRVNSGDYIWEQAVREAVIHFDREKTYLSNLFKNTSGQDSFIRYMTEINQQALTHHILMITGGESLDEKTEMYIRFYYQGMVNLTCDWILGRNSLTAEELSEVLNNSLPEPLHKYMLK